ncbi:MAG: mucoidy inhibitor MuiA family protein [Crocinitomicaceae bacterium]
MRIIITLICLLPTLGWSNPEKKVKNDIDKVVVYQQGAQIERSGYYSINAGVTELVLDGISGQIDPATIQINATGNCVILDSKHETIYPEPIANNQNTEIPPKIKKEISLLQDSLFNMKYDLMDLQNEINVLNSQKRIIEQNGTIRGEGKVNDSIALLREALSLYYEQMNSINAQLLKLDRKKSVLLSDQNRMNNRLSALNNYNINNQYTPQKPQLPGHQIRLTLQANEATKGKIKFTYLVSGAGWTPLYDLRSSQNDATIDLTYKAQVYQNTGVDWERTKLNLSTNNPYANKTKPNLNPWFLDYNTYQTYNRPATESKKKEFAYNDVSQPGRLYAADAELEEGALAMSAEQFMTTVEQLISVEYAINLPYTIKSDGKQNMVLVKTANLSTDYMYYTVPKIDPSVFLVAQITNLDELNLIPGKATIFHDGSFIGNTYVNPEIMSDTMELSLGKTNNIKVKRHLLKNDMKEKVVGDKIEKTYAYRIEVKNHNRKTVKLIIEDQVPVSRNKEIEVEIDDISKAELNEVNGILKWKEKIKPSELINLDLKYTIRYQKDKPINLAQN